MCVSGEVICARLEMYLLVNVTVKPWLLPRIQGCVGYIIHERSVSCSQMVEQRKKFQKSNAMDPGGQYTDNIDNF